VQRRRQPFGAPVEPLETRRLLSAVASGTQLVVATPPTAATVALPARQVEALDRGLVAIRTSGNSTGNIYVGWRLLGTDPSSIGFNLYCSTNGAAPVKLNGSTPITASTNYVHAGQNYAQSHSYFVRRVLGGVEQAPSETFTLPAGAPARQYRSIPLTPPPGGTVPDVANPGSTIAYTYNANDASAGDVDGDGQYELLLKWDPSISKDSSQNGFTGDTFFDCYRLDGTRLWRIDLGRNIRAGAD
jgi:rhamnogalacturonan endolyase